MTLTGTFTFDDLVGMASNEVLEKLLEMGMTVNEFLNIEEEEEEDEE